MTKKDFKPTLDEAMDAFRRVAEEHGHASTALREVEGRLLEVKVAYMKAQAAYDAAPDDPPPTPETAPEAESDAAPAGEPFLQHGGAPDPT